MNQVLDEPLDPQKAKALVAEILHRGVTTYSTHAKKAMASRRLSSVDCVNVLRGGVAEVGEYENGSWRYRFRTNVIVVVIAFVSKTELRIVTAWRI